MEEVLQEWNNLAEQVEIANKAALANVKGTKNIKIFWDPATKKPGIRIITTTKWKKSELPKWQGMQFNIGESTDFIDLILREEHSEEIFYQISLELISMYKENSELDSNLRHIFSKYDAFFKKERIKSLNIEQQKGLFGELYFLKKFLEKESDKLLTIVMGWKGPEMDYHDFQYDNMAIEFKTTTTKAPVKVKISNEKQLNKMTLGNLWLFALGIVKIDGGLTLQQLIDEIIALLSKLKLAKSIFERKLMSFGHQADEFFVYENGYAIDTEYFYNVDDKFPKITNVPNGIGDLNYSVLIAEAKASLTDFDTVIGEMFDE